MRFTSNALLVISAFIGLSACANLSNMTPEQRAAFYAQMQANTAAAQRQQNFLYQQQMQAIGAIGANAQARAPVNCITSYVGQTAYTNCR